ncbi:DUF4387 domain-containing protein [Deltaproteobacteria bacterium OttesenSCG-928-K17]|nr:DUF4387 domain-containing protein [Deltaproteobacteria bacterium OttesenSCG-928-K17]
MKCNLADLTDVIRSKNSGPYEITFDIIFKDEKIFQTVAQKGLINAKDFAALYHIKESEVISVVEFPPAKAIKVTIVRPISSGALGETDVYGAQQHGPLLGLSFEM